MPRHCGMQQPVICGPARSPLASVSVPILMSWRDLAMKLIALVAVIGILLLQWSEAIPLSSVGGPMVIALAFFCAAMAVAIHEAWTEKRGILGWIVSIVVAFLGAFVAAQLGGMVMVFLLAPFADEIGRASCRERV